MSFISDVVEVRQLLRENSLILTLLQNVLLFVPEPRLINLAEVLNDQVFFTNASFSFTEDPKTFRMNSKVEITLAYDFLDSC